MKSVSDAVRLKAFLSSGASLPQESDEDGEKQQFLTKPSYLDWLRNEVIHQGKVFNLMHFYEHFVHDLCICTFNLYT